MNQRTREYPHLQGNFILIIAFIVPLVILTALYVGREIFPFGDHTYLRSDMYHQYLPFYSELWYKLRNHETLFYSLDIGLGVNFTALYAYYLSCPLNFLIALFPHRFLMEVMNGLIILKMCLSSTFFTYYCSKRFSTRSVYLPLFGIFYGLSGYLAAFSWNIMWLDCYMVLPLLILGLERLVKENKPFTYALALGFTILTNYYIAIMVCMSLVFYYLYLAVAYPAGSFKKFVITSLRFAGYSILGGGLSAILLLPVIRAFHYTVSSNLNWPSSFTEYFSILQMFTRHLMNVEPHLALEHHPNIYCGVAVFLLMPLYIMNRRIDLREKIGKCILLTIFLVAFNLNWLNFIWHGLHFPNSLPARQSFIYIFLLLTMCYDAFRDIRHYSRKEIATAFWIAMGFLLFTDQVFVRAEIVEFTLVYLSALFIALYGLLMVLYRKKALPFWLMLFFILLVPIAEVSINYEATALSTTTRSSYHLDNQAINDLVDTANRLSPDEFYRIEKYTGLRTKNDAAWNNYYSASTFSSTCNGGLSELYEYFGMESSTNAYSYAGATPLASALLRVRYILSNQPLVEDTLVSYVASTDGEFLYENNYLMPFGSVIPENLLEEWNYKSVSPFAVQMSFLQNLCGIENIYNELPTETISPSAVMITTERTGRVYLYVTSPTDSVNVYIEEEGKEYSLRHNHIIDLGVIAQGTPLRVTTEDTDHNLYLDAYTMNETSFIDAMNRINATGWNPSTITETHIEGDYQCDTTTTLLLSLPYDLGWTIHVDGEKITQDSIFEALTTITLSPGSHHIVMNYVPENFYLGMTISIVCAILLIVLWFLRKPKNKLGKEKLSQVKQDIPSPRIAEINP
ncbi:MAG: YfhO family protein [Lachnospiraceae bacterium]|nr:YfhO family protein [Lachnospiraceae bacterium]